MSVRIPFNRPTSAPNEAVYAQRALKAGHTAGDGPNTAACSELLQQVVGSQKSLLTTSCTHALEMAALLADIKPGDEVIVPSFTFVSTINAFVLRGAVPVFSDIRVDTLNLDESQLADLLTPRTRAIIPVHYAGVGCEMDEIVAIARGVNAIVVEDNAHGLFGSYRNRPLGSIAPLATQSFHETKNISCGEGGALMINDPAYIERAEIIREKGTNRSRFFRGQVDKYSWVDLGSSYLPSEILAGCLLAQLEDWKRIQARREEIWGRYQRELQVWANSNGVRTPTVPEHCRQSFHMYYLRFPKLESRTRFIKHLGEAGILAVFHYLPLHLSEMGRTYGGREGQCPLTEVVSETLVRLPFFTDLSEAEHEDVIERILEFSC